MTKVLGSFILIVYLALCVAVLGYWLPNFLAVNYDYRPELSWRYLAASGIPFGFLLVTVVARQSLKGFFSIIMFFEVMVAGSLLLAGLITFNLHAQSKFFCAAHLILCGVAVLWNLYQHRRELVRFQRAAAAAAA